MSHSLNSLKGVIYIYRRDSIGGYCRVIKGHTRSLDYGSYVTPEPVYHDSFIE